RRNKALGLAISMIGLWLVLFALTFRRYVAVGTYDEFWSGRARPLNQQPAVVQAFNLITLVTAVPLLALLGAIVWRNRRRRAPALQHARQRHYRRREQRGKEVPEVPGVEPLHREDGDHVREQVQQRDPDQRGAGLAPLDLGQRADRPRQRGGEQPVGEPERRG